MSRLGRWSVNIMAVSSLLLCVATIAAWACSYYHLRMVGAKDGRVLVAGLETNADAAEWLRWEAPDAIWWQHTETRAPRRIGFAGLEFCPPFRTSNRCAIWQPSGSVVYQGEVFRAWLLAVPCCLLALGTAVAPIARGVVLWRRWRRRRSARAGRCRKCSYDLTGNASGVCPECGTEVTTGAA